MKIGILTIGNELTSGRIQDTNSALIARAMQEQGWGVAGMISVGDDDGAIHDAFAYLLARVDGVIVTGARTSEPPSVAELRRVKKSARVPVLIGSGMTPENLKSYFPFADGFIVGSTFRQDGRFLGALEPKRLDAFMRVFRALREQQA